jgi:hypothetical protein
MYELRVLLPTLSIKNPDIARMKKELIEQVERTGTIPSYVGLQGVQLVWLREEGEV